MIRSQRSAHFLTFVALALAIPLLLACALRGRPDRGFNEAAVLAPLRYSAGSQSVFGIDRSAPFESIGLGVIDTSDSDGKRIAIAVPRELAVPDALAYAARELPDGDSLPADARLLDALAPGTQRQYALRADESVLVVFGLAWQELVASGVVTERPR